MLWSCCGVSRDESPGGGGGGGEGGGGGTITHMT